MLDNYTDYICFYFLAYTIKLDSSFHQSLIFKPVFYKGTFYSRPKLSQFPYSECEFDASFT